MNKTTYWQKSSFSDQGGGNCVEVAARDGLILMRESDDPAATLKVGRGHLSALMSRIKASGFERQG
ncbi:DUF397 domain-containing protein [Streptomyces sp. NPDC003077]|uniref:DUF397 domain-containing protein n=1 Tax=Streptomyces sp. NPDC003077 TaxID=3154443 RepID=UPI0033BB4217